MLSPFSTMKEPSILEPDSDGGEEVQLVPTASKIGNARQRKSVATTATEPTSGRNKDPKSEENPVAPAWIRHVISFFSLIPLVLYLAVTPLKVNPNSAVVKKPARSRVVLYSIARKMLRQKSVDRGFMSRSRRFNVVLNCSASPQRKSRSRCSGSLL